MTVTVTNSTSANSGSSWARISGTIAEVLNQLSIEGTAAKVVYWSDNGTTAVAIICRQK